MQDVTEGKGQAAGRNALVPRGVVVEQSPHVEALLLRHLKHAAGHDLVLDGVNLGLELLVLLGAVEQPQRDRAAGVLEGDGRLLVRRVLEVDAVDAQNFISPLNLKKPNKKVT